MLLIRREFEEFHEKQKANKLSDNDEPTIFDAAAFGSVEQLEEALEHWDINAQDDDEMTALHHASVNLRFENVDRLLQEIENGLDPTITDRFDRDAAWAAVEVHGQSDVEATKMYNKLSPYVYPDADEDLDLDADNGMPEVE